MTHKILLADDSITIQKVVNLTFSDEGINVVTVGNGELALKKLNEETFDLVLADIFMPGRNGYEVCEYVKTSPQTADVPVVLLVGAFEPFDKSEAARVRADGHLTKPFESRILIETVKRMLAESAMRQAQQQAAAAPPPPPEGAYKGQVVGWDVSTMQVPPQFEEGEPEPPPYDPYVSTAKLPPLGDAMRPPQPRHEDEEYEESDNRTLNLGAPLPTGALFSAPPESEPEHADSTTPMMKSAPGTFDFADAEMPPTEADENSAAHALEGPPDSVSGFSFNDTGSGPLVGTDAPAEAEPHAESPAIGYQHLHATDSPLDLPDMHVVDSHTHAPAEVREVRDPLLDTFADVAESTATVDAPPDPELVSNAIPEGESSMTVAPAEGLVSAYEEAEIPPASPEPEPEAEAPAARAANLWETQAYTLEEIPPFGFSEEPAPDAPSDSPFELPADDRAPSKPTMGLSDLAGLETLRSSNATQRISVEEMRGLTATPPAKEPVEEPVVEAAPVEEPPVEEVPVDWQPEVQPEPEHAAVAEAPVEAVASENGAGAPLTAIPQDLIDEVVRRTAERISDDVIREIVWEIVPDLAEQLIRKRLEGQ